MSAFKIEKGIPIPSSTRVYPFDEMEVGDSFLAPIAIASSVRQAASAAKKGGRSFRTQVTEQGVRVWRVS